MTTKSTRYDLALRLNWDEVQFIYLDMNGTFMFGCDRFGEEVDYHATYSELGGNGLRADELSEIINQIVSLMADVYQSPDRTDNFPSIASIIADLQTTQTLPRSEQFLIKQTLAMHECGRIDANHLNVLNHLRRKFPLGLLSNLWSEKTVTLDYFARIGIVDWFQVKLFSSDGPYIKPSQSFFKRAHRLSGCAPEHILMIGDDEARDIAPAKAYGFQTVKIGTDTGSCADCCLPNLPTLLNAEPTITST